jgi:hypothetical protein
LHLPTDKSHWIVPIARWAVWESVECEDGSTSSPDAAFVEPMLRRRLSRLAKMSLRVAHDCAHDIPDVRFVFASRHGEMTRTTAMLNDLAAEEDVSPSTFSMSVLNASTGLFSILQHNTAPSTAISAMTESFGYGLLEACLQLADKPEQPVLLVYADEPIPAVYGEPALSSFSAHAIGLLLQSGSARQITCATALGDELPSLEPQSRAFLRCLEDGYAHWQGEATSWAWSTQQQ